MFDLDLFLAVSKARSDPGVVSLDGYFLASAFSITEVGRPVDEWTLLFYNPGNKKTVDCIVAQDVSVGQELPAQKELSELRPDAVKFFLEDAMEAVNSRYSKKTINILISLHSGNKGDPVWTITMVGSDITATSFDIDAISGSVIREETINLMHREK